MSKEYMGVADTARLLRQALKESFPGVKFSVRSSSYSGGASITVRWTDGPTAEAVDAITGKFSGAYFDGMIDYKGYKYHELDGKPVHFGADFIFTERSYSDATVEAALMAIVARYGYTGPLPTVEEYRMGKLREGSPFANERPYSNNSWSDLLHREGFLRERTLAEAAKPSPTLARVKFVGDDGYGAGTVGTKDSPGGARGYPGYERDYMLESMKPAGGVQ